MLDEPHCPAGAGRDDRKSAALAERYLRPELGAVVVGDFAEARKIMRAPGMRQAGIGAEQVKVGNPKHGSVFFLDGELHRQRRTTIARFFTPKAIATRYRATMEATSAELLARLRQTGTAKLDAISFALTASVAAEIIGLTNSNRAGMAERIRKTLDTGAGTYLMGPVRRTVAMAVAVFHAVSMFTLDLLPAMIARRRVRRDDVLSHMMDEGYSLKAMLIECLTYGAAGMVTTREFIVMAAWHLFERDDLRATFVASDEAGQIAILEEILRLEPIASMLHRRAGDDAAAPGTLYAIDVRAANMDEAATGPCPHQLDVSRASQAKAAGSYLSFGDGPHRCPGAQVALHESRLFLDGLLRIPGVRLARAPEMRWRPELMSYELRGAVVTCERGDQGHGCSVETSRIADREALIPDVSIHPTA